MDPRWTRRDSFRWLGHAGGYDSVGAGGPVTGRGYHLICADDLVKDDEAGRSPQQRKTLSDWFDADLVSRREPGGKISLVMSRRHMSDLSGECLANNDELPPSEQWHSLKFTAIQEDGTALWPSRYPLEWLENRRAELESKGKSYMFGSLYQQDPRSDPAACEWGDGCFRDTPDHPLFFDEQPPISIQHKVLAMDASKGADSKAGDFTAILPITLDTQRTLWVGHSFLRRIGWSEAAEEFAGAIIREQPKAAIMDTAMFQETLQAVVQRVLDEHGCRTQLLGFDTGEKKASRIRTDVSPYVERGRIRFLKCSANRIGVNQMREFPSGQNDDFVDALNMGIRLLDRLCA